MFYCDDCARWYGYPQTVFKSEGPCEVCKRTRVCNERKSSNLPPPAKHTPPPWRRERSAS